MKEVWPYTRPREEAERVVKNMKNDLANTPDYDIFGESNFDDKEEVAELLNDLEEVLSGEPAFGWLDAWLDGNNGILEYQDYNHEP